MNDKPFRLPRSLIAAIVLVAFGGGSAPGAPPGRLPGGPPGAPGGHVVITLRPASTAGGDEVLLSDVARVETTDPSLKTWIESLDIVEAPPQGRSVVVSAMLIEYRLRLAGIDPRDVSIRGSAAKVTGQNRSARHSVDGIPALERSPRILNAAYSRPASPVEPAASRPRDAVTSRLYEPPQRAEFETGREGETIEQVITTAARKAVMRQLPWNEDDVEFRLAQPLSRETRLIASGGGCLCSARLRPSDSPVGRVTVDVTVTAPDRSVIEVPVCFDVRHFEQVVATVRPVARGRTIRSEDLFLRRWDVTGMADYCTRPEQVVGRVAGRTLPELQIVKELDLERSPSNATGINRPFVIKRQDRVQMTAKVGNLNISVRGEAQQDGRVGDTIRVQNVESKTIVMGKVVAADEVEINY
jgi:flagella basal body P-ring formation protein FlgA